MFILKWRDCTRLQTTQSFQPSTLCFPLKSLAPNCSPCGFVSGADGPCEFLDGKFCTLKSGSLHPFFCCVGIRTSGRETGLETRVDEGLPAPLISRTSIVAVALCAFALSRCCPSPLRPLFWWHWCLASSFWLWLAAHSTLHVAVAFSVDCQLCTCSEGAQRRWEKSQCTWRRNSSAVQPSVYCWIYRARVFM